VKAGERLAEIHVHYEKQPEYPLTKKEKAGEKLDWRVIKMRLSKDKTSLMYNQFLTLSGIPPEAYDYRLGNARQLAPQVGRVALTILRVVQDGLDVVENVPLADGGIVVAGAELFERPVGDVLASAAAVFGVGVEGEALKAVGAAAEVEFRDSGGHYRSVRGPEADGAGYPARYPAIPLSLIRR